EGERSVAVPAGRVGEVEPPEQYVGAAVVTGDGKPPARFEPVIEGFRGEHLGKAGAGDRALHPAATPAGRAGTEVLADQRERVGEQLVAVAVPLGVGGKILVAQPGVFRPD